MNSAQTRYARSRDGTSIAYQAVGSGAVDLMLTPSTLGNVELLWEIPVVADFLDQLASLSRLLIYDRRGTGLSDRPSGETTMEAELDDMLAVLDAVDSAHPVLMGCMNNGAPAALLAAQNPKRVSALVWYAPTPRCAWAADYPWGATKEQYLRELRAAEDSWGQDAVANAYFERDNPSLAADPGLAKQLTKAMRLTASPAVAQETTRTWYQTDVRHVLPSIAVPTLLIDRAGAAPEEGEYTASLIPGCKRVVLPGVDALPFLGDAASIVNAIREFLGVERPVRDLDRILATVLFTDVVGSTNKACEIGDACWAELLAKHNAAVRVLLARYRGIEVKTTGDGFLATFDGPARAVRCALGICEAVMPLGLELRAGCHTGEIELLGTDVGGIAVHIGARVSALAGPSEVLVSSTVKDLVAGSGLAFTDRGEHELKGVPGNWRLYAAETPPAET
jgi:class 3 adenylate cyclase/pimeloyl-ACP methyl ester carboxylesterase